MKLRLEGAIADERDEGIRSELIAAEAEVDRLSLLVTRLLALASRQEHGSAERCDLAALARRAADRRRAVDLTLAGGPAAAVVHPDDVEQIIDTLLDNASVYAPGPVEMATGALDDRVWIAVRDHGPGMPEAVRERATERFYRSPDAPRGGSGLGLAIVRELAEGDGGDVSIETPDDGGTRIEIRYPRDLAEA
jgi:two-component system OmpR family sensor kinase